MSEIPNTNQITGYMHCRRCVMEVREIVQRTGQAQSPGTYQRLEVGYTPIGIQIWCRRHEANVAHFDFRGATIPVETRSANP